MKLIDTHAHLYLDNFDADRDTVVKNALNAGIEKIVLPNIDSGSVNDLKKICLSHPGFFLPLMGLHPTSVKDDFINELKIVETELKTQKYYGIGETGIDLYWDKTYTENQVKAFSKQIELALEYKLPIIIHARESFDLIFKVLDNYKSFGLKGIFHAFTGTENHADKITGDYGFLLGIGGIVTFKNAGLQQVLKNVSLQNLVLETDSPFLAPVPFRGKRNESAYLVHIAEKIAEIKQCSIEEVAAVTTHNAETIFDLKPE
ncbi:MAG: TatD family hydrolase [Bacteroidales bacterium]|nr:TatD family hydrolase [Bacteroidales bacterium]